MGPSNQLGTTRTVARIAHAALRFCASLKLAVLLIVMLAAVLAWATILETRNGRDYAAWYVYGSLWFACLLGALGVNIFAAAAIRFPWKRHQFGFVVTHLGLLVLLTGSIQTFLGGVEGRVTLTEGERADDLIRADLGQMTATWVGKPEEAPYEFSFRAGPSDWRASKTLDLGEVDGVRARILAYLAHSQPVEEWIADASQRGGPVVRFKVTGQDGQTIAEPKLSDQFFGDAVFVGPVRLQLERAVCDAMKEDFLNPPEIEPGEKGWLTLYYAGGVKHLQVHENLGKKVALDDGLSVEVVEYLPHATPDSLGKFTSKSDAPKNPLVELLIHARGVSKPMRQVASAKEPLLNMDSVYGRLCPVKFRYRHPSVQPPTSLELLQMADGKLVARQIVGGAIEAIGTVTASDACILPGNFTFTITDHLAHAKQKITFVPAKGTGRGKEKLEPAALVELTAKGVTQEVWLQRNSILYGRRMLNMPGGTLALNYGYGRAPLGFGLELVDFRRESNPGKIGNASYSSNVRVVDHSPPANPTSDGGDDASQRHEHVISMNQPLTHGRFTFYQSGFDEPESGKQTSSFNVAYDPGRRLKYGGSLMVCAGIGIMFYMRAYFFKSRRRAKDPEEPTATILEGRFDREHPNTEGESRMRRIAALIVIGIALGGAGHATAEEFQWDLWRDLPVQNGGRQKPLDTLARETVRLLANRASLVDPATQRKIEPLEAYVRWMIEWKGWDASHREQLLVVSDWRPLYFRVHEPDAWDQAELLRVDDLGLRATLGLPAQKKYISIHALSKTNISDPELHREIPFSAWAEELLTKRKADDSSLSVLENKGLELAERYWAYQNHRMGHQIEVLPQTSAETSSWLPLAYIGVTAFGESNDPTGQLRQAQRQFEQLRQAYQAHDAAAFNQATREFVRLVRQVGRAAGDYPSARQISLEVAYNRWAPFRFAWCLMLAASLSLVLYHGSGWRSLYRCGTLMYVAGFAAMVAGFALRVAVAGRPPVTNMYESVVYVGAGISVLGLVFEFIDRGKYVLTAAATVATVILMLADHFPMVLDPSVRPLEPVLRSNFWLVTHVLTITLSYAAFALALGIANITLGHFLINSGNRSAISALSRFTYKCLQVGVLLLAAGIILGGVWADYSWGRFWGWDPKEVWALVALLGYLAVLHARFAGWVGHRGLATLSVACFSLVVMAWYGVNFVLGAGLHSYGFGGGGQLYVGGAVVLQLAYAGLAVSRSLSEPELEPEESYGGPITLSFSSQPQSSSFLGASRS